ncbi:hypothetical protein [Alkalihalobacterium alkalinitrilicum]|nr:hypothetical protein [Alkalihalobacterium alkalinitrilicum]
MNNRKNNRKQPHLEVTNNAIDAEFGIEFTPSKESKKSNKSEKK